MDTYDRGCQLGASRRRLEDAIALHSQKRWTGSTYLAGYAVECALKSLICYLEHENNLKDTEAFKTKLQFASLHNLTNLLNTLPVSVQSRIKLDRTGTYTQAWKLVSSWRNDELRYSDKTGDKDTSDKFLEAVKILHRFLLDQQHEAS